MVISQGPSGSALVQALEGRHAARITPAMALAIGVSLAVHVAAGLYVYNNRFKPMETPAVEEPPPFFIDTVRLPKSEPDATSSPTPSMKVHQAPSRPLTPPDEFLPVKVPPADETVTRSEPTPWDLFGGQEMVTPDLPKDPIPKVIGDPQWVSLPNAAQLTRHYPARAARLGIAGEATLNCAVNATGTVRDCVVTGETPSTFGFGAAALKLSQYFRMLPKTEDGQPIDGGRVSIPIRFRIE